jgi:hypothetical protein
MRVLPCVVLLLLSLPALADRYDELYQKAGWTQQRQHFSNALDAAQTRYRDSLPPAVYQTLVENSNRRFAPTAMDQRAQQSLRYTLGDPQPALQFFTSALGRKIVAAELLATSPQQLALHANGLPLYQPESARFQLIQQLAQALPASEAGVEVSLALAGVAADSLSQMIPGMFSTGAQGLLAGQRQRLMAQIDKDLNNTLLHVYRELSDAELAAFLDFAQSTDGKAYYQAALKAIRSGLNNE